LTYFCPVSSHLALLSHMWSHIVLVWPLLSHTWGHIILNLNLFGNKRLNGQTFARLLTKSSNSSSFFYNSGYKNGSQHSSIKMLGPSSYFSVIFILQPIDQFITLSRNVGHQWR
jgi:hypothetical protein